MIVRYKSKPITPVDAVAWDGQNLEEVQELCPEAVASGPELLPPFLTIPGGVTAVAGDYIIKNVAGGTYSKLSADVFVGLYMSA